MKFAIAFVLLALLAVMVLPSAVPRTTTKAVHNNTSTSDNDENQSGDNDNVTQGHNHEASDNETSHVGDQGNVHDHENETGKANDDHSQHDNETITGNDNHEQKDNDTETNEEHHPTVIRFSAEIDLTGAQQSPPVTTKASGEASISLLDNGTALRFELDVCNIANVTMAHIHVNTTSANGPIVLFLYHMHDPLFSTNRCADLSSGILGPGNLTARPEVGVNSWNDFVKALLAGHAYVNVHTMVNPGGEIRGQIVPESKGEGDDDDGGCGPPLTMRIDLAASGADMRPCPMLADSE